MNEQWKPITGYRYRYKVSSYGRVKSLERMRKTKSGGKCLVPKKILKGTISRATGYIVVGLYRNAKVIQYGVHVLVLTAFVGPCPEGMQCCHRDGNPTNNNVDNLYWGTPKQNGEDKVKHGRSMKGIKHPSAKLKDNEVLEIREIYKMGGSTQSQLTVRYEVSQPVISDIVLGNIWKHI